MAKAVNAIVECIEENNDALNEEYFKTAGRDEVRIAKCFDVLHRMNRGGLIEKATMMAQSTPIGVSGRKKKSRRSGQEVRGDSVPPPTLTAISEGQPLS